MDRQGGVGVPRGLIAPAAVNKHQIEVGIVPFEGPADERLQRDAAVGVVRNERNGFHLGIERADEFDVLTDIVPVEHSADEFQAVRHLPVIDHAGHPPHCRIARRSRQHDAVRADEAAETQHPFGIASERHERSPRLLSQQHDGPQAPVLVPRNQIVDLRHPPGCVVHALAFERLDIDVARNVRSGDLLLEIGDKTGHAARVGIVGGDEQDALTIGSVIGLRPKFGG